MRDKKPDPEPKVKYSRLASMLEVLKCPHCTDGECNDAEPGDISCKTWECQECDGTGVWNYQLIGHSLMAEIQGNLNRTVEKAYAKTGPSRRRN